MSGETAAVRPRCLSAAGSAQDLGFYREVTSPCHTMLTGERRIVGRPPPGAAGRRSRLWPFASSNAGARLTP